MAPSPSVKVRGGEGVVSGRGPSARRVSSVHRNKPDSDTDGFPNMDKMAASRGPVTAQVERLQSEQEKYKAKAEAEKRRLMELQRQEETLQAKVMQRRAKLGGPNAPRDSAEQVKKQIKILQNRLEKALAKHNGTLASNRTLRENIDNLRRERLVFNQMYKKLEKEIVDRKKDMLHIIEVSNRAYEAREAAVNEMARLKAQSDREHQVFEAEFKELGRLIEHDRKMRDYMRVRSKDEAEGANLEDDETHKARKKSGSKSVALRASQSLATVHTSHTADDSQVQSYSEAFAKIQAASGIAEFDDLMSTFISAEDENYRFYKYVDELTQEISRLEEQILDIQKEIEQYRVVDESKSVSHEGEQSVLQQRLDKTAQKTEQLAAKQQAADSLIETLKTGIWNAYTKLGCDVPDNREIVGEDGITTRNMMTVLSLLEQRSTKVLQVFTSKQNPTGLQDDGAPVLHSGTTITIEPPSTTDKVNSDSEEEEEEEEDRPLTRHELQMKTLKSLHKRDSAVARKKQNKQEAAQLKQDIASGVAPGKA
mmetsp:Transcript_40729/g.77773  ORF Transcript_40729/g.77773 Transcript_40729/m.77773 type:complete len:538 (+) Transcript_40729:438-2051(+)|eukprot:CAMPEP_0114246158 /NCGR_PEP_ID=MMETSP0058-20121206/12300_1 /TAXON_ID=36894 /ORGANISM="Pyramimonas parkeae, CCMP726" /LENGTH=537 /DNA_ID=CAMNT_0001359299 /DNA_START=444 /DNA_END=2057 /DNA_ORIENTATION=-